LHVFQWPKDGKLLVPGLANRVRSATLLANRQDLPTAATPDGLVVRLPAEPLDSIDTVVRLEIDGPLNIAKVLPKPAADGSITLPAQLPDIHNPGHGPGIQVESKYGSLSLGFRLDPRSWVEWSFRIGKPGNYDAVAHVAMPKSGSRLVVVIGKQKKELAVAGTGGYDEFKSLPIGQFSIERSGDCKLQIKPVVDGWTPINLRSIVLTPRAR
jgi:alpha-L-fucosidase